MKLWIIVRFEINAFPEFAEALVVCLGVEKEDEGMYTCVVENQFNSQEVSAFLTVTGVGKFACSASQFTSKFGCGLPQDANHYTLNSSQYISMYTCKASQFEICLRVLFATNVHVYL